MQVRVVGQREGEAAGASVSGAAGVHRSALPGGIAAILLALFALQVVVTSSRTSPAYDEAAILPAGYVFLKTGQWRVMPEHPPLIPALSALPLLFMDLRLDFGDPLLARDRPNPWNVGLNFLALNNADDRLFFWGRLPVLLLALLLGYVVYRWARELYGGGAGLLALLLYAFSPDLVAHAGFISHDVGVACFATLSLYALWRFITRGTSQSLPWAGVLLGCALGTKGTAIVLPPLFVVLMLLAVWRYRGRDNGHELGSSPSGARALAAERVVDRLRLTAGALGVIFAVAFGVLYSIYLFPADPLVYAKDVVFGQTARDPSYLYYLMGQFRTRTHAWWYYFPVAYLIKTPIPMLLLIPLAFWHWWRHGKRRVDEVFLLLPAAAFLVLVSAVAYPVGTRYLFPIYPLLFIFVSRTAGLFTRRTIGVVAGIVLAAWYVSTPLRVHPDYLAYFNELVGGPSHGIEYLDDSNIEWGQHLKRLKRYLDEHRLGPVRLVYFTTGRPEYYGLPATRLDWSALAGTPTPGIYIVGAYDLIRAKANYGVDWLKRYPVVDRIGYSIYVFRVS